MKLLALDTSSMACSVALGVERVIERHEVRPKEHTRLLIPMIEDVLEQGGVTLPELDAVVLGNGPGSFIGLRIGASVAQGICFGARRKLIPVSSLAVVAAEAMERSGAAGVVVAQDAHMNEVYLAWYRRAEDGSPLADGEAVLQPIAPIDRLAASEEVGRWHAAGDAWQRYADLRRLNEERLSGVIDVRWPRARYLLELGERSYLAGGAIDAGALVPEYVRNRVAA
jgi:tRNA threonylcarbamoyladenosine biosynthesis protein TsaB